MLHHDHPHSDAGGAARLGLATAAILGLAAIEFAGGLVSHSVALTADAGHLATDGCTLALSWYVLRRAGRPATSRHTYGFHRAGIVVAGLNAALLIAVAAAVAAGAAARLRSPATVETGPVIVIALGALLINASLSAFLGRSAHNLTTRAATLHLLSDAASSLGVVVAAVVIALTGWQRADGVVSLGIAALILAGAVPLLREAIAIINETVPRDLDADEVRACIAATPGVDDVHDLHIWSLDRTHRMLSAHVAVEDRSLAEVTALLRELEGTLCARFGIEHATLQPECPSCVSAAPLYCDLDDRHAAHEGTTREGASAAP